MNDLYTGSSAAQRGTLYHVRNKFGHRGVKKHVMENVPHVYDLLDLATDGVVCLAAMHIESANDLSKLQLPQDGSKEFLQRLAKDIVDVIWPEMNMAEVTDFNDGTTNDSGDNPDDDDPEDEKLVCHCKTASADWEGRITNILRSIYKHSNNFMFIDF